MLVIDGSSHIDETTAVALGMFDGVHQGHKAIIEQATNYAKNHNIKSAVITLSQHPKSLTRGESPRLITDLDSRLAVFEELGVDIVLLIEFTQEVMNMEPEEYLQEYLLGTLNARFVSIGYDHHFGRERKGCPSLLKLWCEENNINLAVLDAFHINDELVSSSSIRAYVTEGLIEPANTLLGHALSLRAKVVHGDHRGRELGFPTANLEPAPLLQIPANGVYRAKANVVETFKQNTGKGFSYEYSCKRKEQYDALVNIGYKPTFNKSSDIKPVIEAHLLDFDSDIYGENLELTFLEKIRDEQEFVSKEALIKQIKQDLAYAKSQIGIE